MQQINETYADLDDSNVDDQTGKKQRLLVSSF
jgi:hypothetical protein